MFCGSIMDCGKRPPKAKISFIVISKWDLPGPLYLDHMML